MFVRTSPVQYDSGVNVYPFPREKPQLGFYDEGYLSSRFAPAVKPEAKTMSSIVRSMPAMSKAPMVNQGVSRPDLFQYDPASESSYWAGGSGIGMPRNVVPGEEFGYMARSGHWVTGRFSWLTPTGRPLKEPAVTAPASPFDYSTPGGSAPLMSALARNNLIVPVTPMTPALSNYYDGTLSGLTFKKIGRTITRAVQRPAQVFRKVAATATGAAAGFVTGGVPGAVAGATVSAINVSKTGKGPALTLRTAANQAGKGAVAGVVAGTVARGVQMARSAYAANQAAVAANANPMAQYHIAQAKAAGAGGNIFTNTASKVVQFGKSGGVTGNLGAIAKWAGGVIKAAAPFAAALVRPAGPESQTQPGSEGGYYGDMGLPPVGGGNTVNIVDRLARAGERFLTPTSYQGTEVSPAASAGAGQDAGVGPMEASMLPGMEGVNPKWLLAGVAVSGAYYLATRRRGRRRKAS